MRGLVAYLQQRAYPENVCTDTALSQLHLASHLPSPKHTWRLAYLVLGWSLGLLACNTMSLA